MDSLFCGKATAVAARHWRAAKSRLSNPPPENPYRKKTSSYDDVFFLVGEGGFEPPKSLTTDLQSAPFGHSGIPPYSVRCAAGIGAGRRARTPDLLITKVCVYVHQIQFILSSPNMPSVRIASRAIKPCSINGSFARWRQNSDSSRNRPRVRDAHGGAVNSSL